MSRGVLVRVAAAVAAVALCECSARYLVSGTVASPDGDPLPGVLVAPRLKCGGNPTPSAYSDETDRDGGFRSAFSYASDHTVVEFSKGEYATKCVDLAPLWRPDCPSGDAGAADRCATVDVTMARLKNDADGGTQPPLAPTLPPPTLPAEDAGTPARPVPMTD